MLKDILLFPLSTCPANIALVRGKKNPTWPGRKGEATFDEYLQEASLESRRCLVTWALNFVHSGRHGGVQVMT